MYIYLFHFEVRVASWDRCIVQLYSGRDQQFPSPLGYKGTNNDRRVNLQLLKSYKDVNEQEELAIWLYRMYRFHSVKTLLESNTNLPQNTS